MDDNVDYIEYQPGHLHLQLNINRNNCTDVSDNDDVTLDLLQYEDDESR